MKKIYPILTSLLAAGVINAAPVKVASNSDSAKEKASSSVAAMSTDRQVIAQKQLAPGVTKRVVKDAQGRIFADMVRDGRVSAAPSHIRPVRKAPAGVSFYEGFESHAGELDWIPEGWTEINTDANIPTEEMCRHNINNSWSVQNTGDGYWTDITSDGVKECWIHFTYAWSYVDSNGEKVAGGPDLQDEWLVTPSIKVGQDESLFFLAEFDLGAVFSYDWSTYKYDRNVVEYDLEVLASVDDGATWKSLWKISEDICSQMTDSEMYDAMAELKYAPYSLPLKEYAGKDVKIAFRYFNLGAGFCGNSAAVDAVTVSAPMPEAFYDIPASTLLSGITDGLHVRSESIGLYPAYADIEWTSGSNAYTTSHEWNFADIDGVIESKNAVVNYPYTYGNTVAWPVLVARNDYGADFYSFDDKDGSGMLFGGYAPEVVEGETSYVGNYDYQNKGLVTPYLAYGEYVYGTHAETTWSRDGSVVQTKVGNLFYAPAAPLTVYDVMLTLGEFDADPDAEFLLEIFPVNDRGQVAEQPAATAKVLASEIDGFGFYNAVFHLDTPYRMEGHTLMMVSGYAGNSKVRTFAACAQSKHNDAAHNYAYMMFELGGEQVLLPASDALIDYASALMLSLNAAYHFVRPEEEIIDLNTMTNDYLLAFEATNSPENWWIVDGEEIIPIAEGGVAYDWLSVAPSFAEDGGYMLQFSAEPSAANRAKTVEICNGGDVCRVRVRQSGGTGVATVADGNGLKIEAGMLTVSGLSKDVVVEIYNAGGVKVKSGFNGLDVNALGHGVYLVKAAGNIYKLAL